MIALAGYQFTEFRRGRSWLPLLVSYLSYLLVFLLRISRDAPGAYGRAAIGLLAVAVGLGWTLCASQQPALWQITVVSAGSRERAQLSRVLLSFAMLIPPLALTVLVAAEHQLTVADPLPGLAGVLVLFGLLGLAGCALGVLAGRRRSAGSIVPVTVLVDLALLSVLLHG